MLIIPVKEGESIDKALKRFKRKFDRTGKLKSLRERQATQSPLSDIVINSSKLPTYKDLKI